MQGIGFVLMCVAAAVVYGVVHDQITARVCVEYFTLGHPPVFDTRDPTLLGFGWGFVTTWWAGLALGVALAVAARAGSRSKRTMRSLLRPVFRLIALMAAGAFAAGVLGWFLARGGMVFLVGPIATDLPSDRHVPFLACLWAHTASYAVGFAGGAITLVLVWRSRRDEAMEDAAGRGLAPTRQ